MRSTLNFDCNGQGRCRPTRSTQTFRGVLSEVRVLFAAGLLSADARFGIAASRIRTLSLDHAVARLCARACIPAASTRSGRRVCSYSSACVALKQAASFPAIRTILRSVVAPISSTITSSRNEHRYDTRYVTPFSGM